MLLERFLQEFSDSDSGTGDLELAWDSFIKQRVRTACSFHASRIQDFCPNRRTPAITEFEGKAGNTSVMEIFQGLLD